MNPLEVPRSFLCGRGLICFSPLRAANSKTTLGGRTLHLMDILSLLPEPSSSHRWSTLSNLWKEFASFSKFFIVHSCTVPLWWTFFYAKKAFFQLILGKLSLIVFWRGNIRRIQENWPEMITAVFHAIQGGIHPKITSGWVSPFINRNDDISGNLNRKQNRRAVRPLAHFQDSLHFDAVLLLSELAGGGGSGGRRYELLQKC